MHLGGAHQVRYSQPFQHLMLAAGIAAWSTSPGRLGAQVAGIAGVRGAVPVSIGPFELSTRGTVERIGSSMLPRTALSLETNLRAPLWRGGVWVGSALEGAHEIDTIPIRPLLRFGIWQSIDAIRVSIGASSHTARIGGRASTFREVVTTDTLGNHHIQTFGDSGSPSKLALWSEVESQVSWRINRATFSVVLGARPDVQRFQPSVWGHLGATYELTPYAALVGVAGTDAPRIALGIPAVRFASLALRFSPWRSSAASPEAPRPETFVVRASGQRRYTITYRATGVKTVELSGDFAGWTPTPLTQTRAGVWQTTVIAGPGTYHVNLRVNGGQWFAPPGLPQTEDDFNGTVGILVLR